MRNRLVLAASLVMTLGTPAFAQSVAGSYEVKFEEMATTCDPVRFTYTRGTVRVATGKRSLTVNIETIPQMIGVPAKSGKIKAKTPKKLATTIQGIDGKYSVSGRVDDSGVVELVLVGEFTRQDNGKPLCTQSWNLRGVRRSNDKDAKSAADPIDTVDALALIPSVLTAR